MSTFTPSVQTVLVVDDEDHERTKMGRIIEGQGFCVVTAGTCLEARSIFERAADIITLLVADVSLPDGNGFELAIALRQLRPGLRIIFVSGSVGAEVRRFYGRELQDFQFLAKPFTAAQLSAEVLAALKSSVRTSGSAG